MRSTRYCTKRQSRQELRKILEKLGRTSFSLFRFRTRDGILLAVFGGLAAAIFTCFSAGGYSFFYYPYVMKLVIGWKEGISAVMILVFFCIPGIIELEEKRKWSY